MSNKIDVAAENDLSEGTMKAVTVEGQEVLLARTKDGFHAVGNICPHMKGRLSEGVLEGKIVTCPRHGSQFDVTNGEVIRWLKGKGVISAAAKIIKPPRGIESYKVELKDGRVLIVTP
ncbi:MAG: Rieske 2Fe-2S domain-containing protein [Dehalococcoidales bacterium]|nr:Rieske 2Fe-2S domain-containing protein [Dehalococcoidales bacterium]